MKKLILICSCFTLITGCKKSENNPPKYLSYLETIDKYEQIQYSYNQSNSQTLITGILDVNSISITVANGDSFFAFPVSFIGDKSNLDTFRIKDSKNSGVYGFDRVVGGFVKASDSSNFIIGYGYLNINNETNQSEKTDYVAYVKFNIRQKGK